MEKYFLVLIDLYESNEKYDEREVKKSKEGKKVVRVSFCCYALISRLLAGRNLDSKNVK